MSENGRGKVAHIETVLEELRAQMALRSDHLLLDWKQEWPTLRKLMLGTWNDNPAWSPARLTVQCDGGVLRISFHVRGLHIECEYFGHKLSDLLDAAEGDLVTSQTPWREDWKVRQARDRKLERAVDGS